VGKNDNRKNLFSILHLSKAGWLAATEYFEVHGKGQEGRRKGRLEGWQEGSQGSCSEGSKD
jgi:predicted transposase YdaD